MYRPLIAAALAATTLAAPAFAGTTPFKMEVSYTKAKLATPAGAAEEYASIREQVVRRCEVEHADRSPIREFEVEWCTKRTLTSAVRAIGDANLTGVHTNAGK